LSMSTNTREELRDVRWRALACCARFSCSMAPCVERERRFTLGGLFVLRVFRKMESREELRTDWLGCKCVGTDVVRRERMLSGWEREAGPAHGPVGEWPDLGMARFWGGPEVELVHPNSLRSLEVNVAEPT